MEAYRVANCSAECNAVWYSDVIIPRRYGYEASREIFGGMSVAEAFDRVGLGEEAARQAIESIELRGVIPDSILQHPEFEALRPVFVDRLLKYHVMDELHTRILYETWHQNPEVAKVALRFGAHQQSQAEYQAQFSTNLDRILAYAEGANPLQAKLTRLGGFDLRVTALRLAFLIQRLEAEARPGAAEAVAQARSAIESLYQAHQRLGPLKAQVQGTEPSAENLAAFRTIREVERGPLAEARALELRLSQDPELLAKETRQALEGRVVPHFEELTLDPLQIAQGLKRVLAENLARLRPASSLE